MEEVRTIQIAHMIAQMRAKQLAMKDQQDRMQKSIVTFLGEYPEISVRQLESKIRKNISQFYVTSEIISHYLQWQATAKEVGYAILFSKTAKQLAMAQEWVESQEEDLIGQINKGEFYHKLPNTISDQLPVLGAFSETTYWGNENPSVSATVLVSILAVLNKEFGASLPMDVLGEAAFFPFADKKFHWPPQIIEKIKNQQYPFAHVEGGMDLYGDYQYGGQRVFGENQQVLGPEDCSSSVGKATYLTTGQVNNMSTKNMIDAYSDHYKVITVLNKDEQVTDKQLALIEPGDIYLVKGHTALIATKPDNRKDLTTLQFSRDIDSPKDKILGGGRYDYNLSEKTKTMDITILRPSLLDPLPESCSLSYLLNKIDNDYKEIFPNGPTAMVGDCRIFLPSWKCRGKKQEDSIHQSVSLPAAFQP